MSLVDFPPPNGSIGKPVAKEEAQLSVADQYKKSSDVITDILDGVLYTIKCKKEGEKDDSPYKKGENEN